MKMINFEATLVCPGGAGTWTYVFIPFNPLNQFGKKTNIHIKGLIDNKYTFQSTIISRGENQWYLVIPKNVRNQGNLKEGDKIKLSIELDDEFQNIDIPDEFACALNSNQKVFLFFNKLAPSHKKNYIRWINDAKTDSTKQRRISESIKKLEEGKKLR